MSGGLSRLASARCSPVRRDGHSVPRTRLDGQETRSEHLRAAHTHQRCPMVAVAEPELPVRALMVFAGAQSGS